ILTYGVRGPLERFGVRRSLVGLSLLSVAGAALFLAAHHPWLVVLAAMIANVAVGVGETGPFLSIEQVIVTRAIPFDRRTSALSLYHFVGYGAAALGAACPKFIPSFYALFPVFLVASLAQFALFLMLPEQRVERKPGARGFFSTSPVIREIAALFSLDSFGGGFVTQSLVAYYLHQRFALPIESLGGVFFASTI